MKRFAPLLALLVLIGVLALLNRNINKSAGGDTEALPPPPPAAKTAVTPASDPLPPEITLGSPATTHSKITVGWVYDATNQPNPAALRQAIDAVKEHVAASGGTTSAEIVNLDVPPGELSAQAGSVIGLGVAVNGEAGATVGGKEIALAGNPGEGDITAVNINTALGALLGAKP